MVARETSGALLGGPRGGTDSAPRCCRSKAMTTVSGTRRVIPTGARGRSQQSAARTSGERPGRGPLPRLTIDLSCTCGVPRADLRMLIAGLRHLHVILDEYAAPRLTASIARAGPGLVPARSLRSAPPTSCHRRYGVGGSPAGWSASTSGQHDDHQLIQETAVQKSWT